MANAEPAPFLSSSVHHRACNECEAQCQQQPSPSIGSRPFPWCWLGVLMVLFFYSCRVLLPLLNLYLGLGLLPHADLGFVGLESEVGLGWDHHAVCRPLQGEVFQMEAELAPERVAVVDLLLPPLCHGDGLGALAVTVTGGKREE